LLPACVLPALLLSQEATAPPSDWHPDLQSALALYVAGDFDSVRQYCQDLSQNSTDQALRRDAAALHALTLLRSPARDNCLDGRAQLLQLASDDPGLRDRPECNLALGLAALTLSETSTALDCLSLAAQGFERQHLDDRLAEACCALASAWVVHQEWELTPPQFHVARPASPAQADAIRRQQLDQLRTRLAALPHAHVYLARLDLITAKYLLAQGDEPTALARLKQLTAKLPFSPSQAEAALFLATYYEEHDRPADALQLLDRVRSANLGTFSTEAGRRAQNLQSPRLELSVPARVRPDEPWSGQLRARGLTYISCELRRVDLAPWLTNRQGRFSEPHLPVAGSLIASCEPDVPSEAPLAWQSSRIPPLPNDWRTPAGTYVLTARATSSAGRELVAQRLLVVSSLDALFFIGTEQALLWVGRADDYATTLIPASAGRLRFWMHGSFVPAEHALQDGSACFPLPPEARLLRDKRWTCLVEADGQTALLRGDLPSPDTASAAPRVTLVGGPSVLELGTQLHLVGILDGAAGEAAPSDSPPLTLECLDALGRVRATQAAHPDAAGIFAADFAVTPELADAHLNFVARQAGRVLESRRGRLNLYVPPTDATPVQLECRLPLHLPPQARSLTVEATARYPWGVPLDDAGIAFLVRSIRLPTATNGRLARMFPESDHNANFPPDGRYSLDLETADWAGGDVAVNVWTTLSGWDQRLVRSYVTSLVSAQPAVVWIESDPTEPHVGDLVRFFVGRFDPTLRTAGAKPQLTVRHGADPPVMLPLYPGPLTMRSGGWRPTEPGQYEVTVSARLDSAQRDYGQLAGDQSITERILLTVGGPTSPAGPTSGRSGADPPLDPPPLCEALFEDTSATPAIQLRVDPLACRPLLAIAFAASEPSAVRCIPASHVPTTFDLPVPASRVGDLRVCLAEFSPAGWQVPGTFTVQPVPQRAWVPVVQPALVTAPPSSTASVDVTCLRWDGSEPDGATLIARLVRAADEGYVPWRAGAPLASDDSVAPVARWTSDEDWRAAPRPVPLPLADDGTYLDPSLRAALHLGETLWTQRLPLEPVTHVTFPIPSVPDRYRLHLLARSNDGSWAATVADIDAHDGLNLQLSVSPRMSVGDRTLATLTLANPGSAPLSGQVCLDLGVALHVESVRFAGADHSEDLTAPDFSFTLPPGSTRRLTARVEAAQPGRGVVTATVTTTTATQSTQGAYEIYPDVPMPNDTPLVRIRRAIALVQPESDAAPPGSPPRLEFHETPRPPVMYIPLRPGERIAPGHVIRVREELEIDRPLPACTWTQRIPPTFHTLAETPAEVPQLGLPGPRWLDSLAFNGDLPAGQRTHEYFLLAVRPGSGLLPPPHIDSAGQLIPASTDPTETRLTVPDSDD